jgi:hypothetical protein
MAGSKFSVKRVGPVSIVFVMLFASLFGIASIPTLMPDVAGLIADAAKLESDKYVKQTFLISDDGPVGAESKLTDWVVFEQEPSARAKITSDTPVTLRVRLTDDAVARRAEEARLAAEKAERERVAAQKAEQKRQADEQARAEREAAAKADRERIATEKAEEARLAAEQAERDRIATEAQAEKERKAAALQAEKDRKAAELQAEKERKAAEKADRDRAAAEQAERDREAAASNQSSSGGASSRGLYKNCTEVWAELGRPIMAGEPGFHSKLDGNGDGVGCEQRPRK